jgi:hypothetical protein
MSQRKVSAKVQTDATTSRRGDWEEELIKNIVLNNYILSKRESQTISNGHVDLRRKNKR